MSSETPNSEPSAHRIPDKRNDFRRMSGQTLSQLCGVVEALQHEATKMDFVAHFVGGSFELGVDLEVGFADSDRARSFLSLFQQKHVAKPWSRASKSTFPVGNPYVAGVADLQD